ncbi:MAG: tRNA (adenosine(37)-N6)-dimethylallyltransferase MiaA [Treponema sp.]|nr:tRNA (adenosine(37)-N6)-dimethylallyltransferase MiaA [Treponema sp.]
MEEAQKIPAVVIFAPTACGKTALAREIFGKSSLFCFKGRGEVVSADSQAVYKYLDIGSAKPSPDETADIPHHLVDFVMPDVQFGVGEFLELADGACAEIYSRGKIPVVMGGTGFYIKSFLMGLPPTPISDPVLRESIKKRLSEEGNGKLFYELKQIDPEYAKKINPHDGYRICRALEVYYAGGKNLSSYKIPGTLRPEYSFCTIILTRGREDLYARIDARVDRMFEAGLEKEIEYLRNMGFTKDSPAMKAIGYSEFFRNDCMDLDGIKSLIKFNTKRYAKKQYTFMKGIPGAVEIPADRKDLVVEKIRGFISAGDPVTRKEFFPGGWLL